MIQFWIAINYSGDWCSTRCSIIIVVISKTHEFVSVYIQLSKKLVFIRQNKLSTHPEPNFDHLSCKSVSNQTSYYNSVVKWRTQLAQQPPCKDQVFDWCKLPPAAHHWSHPEWPNVPCLCSRLWSRTLPRHGNRQTRSVCWTACQSRANALHIHCVKKKLIGYFIFVYDYWIESIEYDLFYIKHLKLKSVLLISNNSIL